MINPKSYAYLGGNTIGSVISTDAGNLSKVIIGVAGTTSELRLYDGSEVRSELLIARITTTSVGNFNFGELAFRTGLYVVASGATPASITIVYE